MTSEEFLKEVLSSPLCPDNFEEIYKEFRKYQKITMDTLIEFHRVCEKSNIEYELAYGSLLGAIRDNGQIPWDYDIDVFVAFKDKERLIETLKKELDDKYYFYCPEVNQKCRHVIMRLAPKGYRSEALHVDVFYYVGTPNSVEERKLHIEQIKRTAHTRYCKLVNCKEEAGGNVKKYIRLMLDKMKYSMIILCLPMCLLIGMNFQEFYLRKQNFSIQLMGHFVFRNSMQNCLLLFIRII